MSDEGWAKSIDNRVNALEAAVATMVATMAATHDALEDAARKAERWKGATYELVARNGVLVAERDRLLRTDTQLRQRIDTLEAAITGGIGHRCRTEDKHTDAAP